MLSKISPRSFFPKNVSKSQTK
uniref:Uncharacterized protein n=1 Tax=Rhizophora mucronata TaxID=61149 RepID=A0A2P2PES3_RHIMU